VWKIIFISAKPGSTLDFQMLSVEQRSAKTPEEMVEKLSRWLEDFKTEFAADYAAIATPRKHNPARTYDWVCYRMRRES
jgi:hypothetical protein